MTNQKQNVRMNRYSNLYCQLASTLNLASILNHGWPMKRFSYLAAAVFLFAGLSSAAGCNESGIERDFSQTNLIDKSVFEGEWWYNNTIVDLDGESALVSRGFEGSMGYDLAVDYDFFTYNAMGVSFNMFRIRFVLDEDFLYLYRSYELIRGGNEDGRDDDFRGQPVQAFPVEHVDVRQDYNPGTGELTNVKVENTTDRRWYERDFVRVHWDQPAMVFSFTNGGEMEFIQEGANFDYPESYRPKYTRVSDDPDYRFRDEWPDGTEDTVHNINLVTRAMAAPGLNCNSPSINGGGLTPCTSTSINLRTGLLRIPPNHDYAVATQNHREFDRFGTFRSLQRTYVRGGRDLSELRIPCSNNADCDFQEGGTCFVNADTTVPGDNYCTGGVTSDQGELDFLSFYRPRHNFWADSLLDKQCRADWECDGRFSHTAGQAGSQCDVTAQRCTIPMKDRVIRPVAYTLNKGHPVHMTKSSFQVVGEWNEAFMRGQRGVQGRMIPTGPDQSCQTNDPTAYCFCGAPEEIGGSCTYRYDPFMTPADAMAAGVVEPYDCHITNTMGFVEPANPSSFDEYTFPDANAYEFTGSECMMILNSNTCMLDAEAEAEGRCEELGDLRYQFYNYISHGGAGFGGVAIPLVDPTTGELLVSNANYNGIASESYLSAARDYFPVLRNEPGAVEDYFQGENVRDFYAGTGRVERPASGFAASASNGFGVNPDLPRPAGLPVDRNAYINEQLDANMEHVEQLRGMDGRARVMSGRLSTLAGTDVEARLMGSLGRNGTDAIRHHVDVENFGGIPSITDERVLNQVSPFRDGFLAGLNGGIERELRQGSLNIDPLRAPELESASMGYFAKAFAGQSGEQAGIRMAQMNLKNVMRHEMGHCIGMTHNFAASYDRHNFHDGFFNRAFGEGGAEPLALPSYERYDTAGLGGNEDGFVGGEEVNRYLAALREVRDARSEIGLDRTMSASTMDYYGFQEPGLGRYDFAHAMWNHFDQVEVFSQVGETDLANAVINRSSDSLDGVTRSHVVDRELFNYYSGGESCIAASDCPYAAGKPTVDGQPVTQRCLSNPRISPLPQNCGDGETNCVCSGFDTDMLDFTAGRGYENGTGGEDAVADYSPIKYLFCSDTRTNDISWCNRFDAGESFQESMDHFRRDWQQRYPTSYFRRYRANGPTQAGAWGSMQTAAKIFQHLYFRLFNEPGFRENGGPLGLDDQYQASIDAMDWFTEMATLPESGSYTLNTATNTYEFMGNEENMDGSDMTLPLGQGYPMWSEYQTGLEGWDRIERSGVFYDKYLALLALAQRDWGLNFSADERYLINFHTLFPVEMTEFFGGLVLDDPAWFAPRASMVGGSPQVTPLTWFRGCRQSDPNAARCQVNQEDLYTNPAIGGTSNEVLRSWATILALAEFPVYFDPSFEQRLSVFKMGTGDGFTVNDVQADGSPTCAYGDATLEASHVTGCDDPDYVVYESDRLRNSYVAVQVRSRQAYNLDVEQVGFALLAEQVDKQEDLRALRAIAAPTAAQRAQMASLETELNRGDSFLEYLIGIQRRYGISGL